MMLTPEHRAILRSLRDNHLAMRLRACRARSELKDAGYIVGSRSGNWKADRRHTYWHLTPAGHAVLSDTSHTQNTQGK